MSRTAVEYPSTPLTEAFALPPLSAYTYKFNDDGYLLDYHGTKVFYPMYESLPLVEKFRANSKDICIVTFPKAGTKFMSAVIWMITHDADPASLLQDGTLEQKLPYLEFYLPSMPVEVMPAYTLNRQKPPRIFLTHLGYDALPQSIKDNAKLVYVARNPKDVIVSTNYFFRSVPFMGCTSTMAETAASFTSNNCAYGPFYNHVAGCYRHLANRTNLFFTTYEEMVKDLRTVVVQLASFLEKDLDSNQIDNIVRYCSFREMKRNDLTNQSRLDKVGLRDFSVSEFLRKGKIGDWKSHLSPEINLEVNKWMEREESRVAGDLNGFRFQFE